MREWRKQKKQLESLPKKKRWLDGGGHKAAILDMVKELIAWIDVLSTGNLRVTRSGVQGKAIELVQISGNEEFGASRRWLE